MEIRGMVVIVTVMALLILLTHGRQQPDAGAERDRRRGLG